MVNKRDMNAFVVAYYTGCLQFFEYLFDTVAPDKTINISLGWRTILRCQKCFLRQVLAVGTGVINSEWAFLGWRCRFNNDLNFRLGQGFITLYFKDSLNSLIAVVVQDYRNLIGLGSRTKVFCNDERELVTLAGALDFTNPTFSCVAGEKYSVMADREDLTALLVPANTILTLGFESSTVTAIRHLGPVSPSNHSVFFHAEDAICRIAHPSFSSVESAFTPVVSLEAVLAVAEDVAGPSGADVSHRPRALDLVPEDYELDSDSTLSEGSEVAESLVPAGSQSSQGYPSRMEYPDRVILRARRIADRERERALADMRPMTSPDPERTGSVGSQTASSGYQFLINGRSIVIQSIESFLAPEGLIYVLTCPPDVVNDPGPSGNVATAQVVPRAEEIAFNDNNNDVTPNFNQ